jgi:hypothetical protein
VAGGQWPVVSERQFAEVIYLGFNAASREHSTTDHRPLTADHCFCYTVREPWRLNIKRE